MEQLVKKTDSIVRQLTSSDGTGIVTLVAPESPGITALTTGEFYSNYIQSLRLKIELPGFTEAAIPALEPDMSRAERVSSIRNIEWNSPRVEAGLLLKQEGGDWVEIARISCLNRPPYYTIDLMHWISDNADFNLGQQSYLGFQVQDVGFGSLNTGDSLTVFGSLSREVWSVAAKNAPFSVCSTSDREVTAGAVELPANAQRKYLLITNESSEPLRVKLGAAADGSSSGHTLTGVPGSAYEIAAANPYTGIVTVSCDGGGAFTVTECES